MVATYPTLASTFTVVQSYEKRPMNGLKISSSRLARKCDGTIVNQKKAVWWDGGIHVREWINPATNIHLAHALLSNYSRDSTITQVVDQCDYDILPVFNVDGYAYTWKKVCDNKSTSLLRFDLSDCEKIASGVGLEAKRLFHFATVPIRIEIEITNSAMVSSCH
jgi:murein tripeptide amidase MpaA